MNPGFGFCQTLTRFFCRAAMATSFIALSCSKATPSRLADEPATEFEMLRWAEKAARVLRLGDGLSAGDDTAAIVVATREQTLERFMQDARFLDTVLDFNLYFLRFKPDTLFRRGYDPVAQRPTRFYDQSVSLNPSALTATMALATGGDYFRLFDWTQETRLMQLFPPFPPNGDETIFPPNATDAEKRQILMQRLISHHDAIERAFDPAATTAIQGRCRILQEELSNDFFGSIFATGLSSDIISSFTEAYFNLQVACFIDPEHIVVADRLRELQSIRERYGKFAQLFAFDAAMRMIQSVWDLPLIDPATYGLSRQNTAFTQGGAWNALQNSSTNYNRRRAAYVLRTFFCDDLTPINLTMPESHAQNRHASDPGCQACHYKLDPMAGFFRSRGASGLDLGGLPKFVFDDQLVIEGERLENYMSFWRAAVGSSRQWDVGYVRSPVREQLNTYGESLEDLFAIIRHAPEVRQCLVRRMAEYYVGEQQAFDGDWLRYLQRDFDAAVQSSDPGATSAAYRSIVKKLLLSETFTTPDPEADQCYDYDPGMPRGGVPCRVASIVRNNCAMSCHSASSAAGRLDLSQWITLPDGTQNFVHKDDNEQQKPHAVTFASLQERLSTTEGSRLMPLNRHMSPQERADLFKWISDNP